MYVSTQRLSQYVQGCLATCPRPQPSRILLSHHIVGTDVIPQRRHKHARNREILVLGSYTRLRKSSRGMYRVLIMMKAKGSSRTSPNRMNPGLFTPMVVVC